MGRKPQIPDDLKRRPFTLDDARAAGLTRKHLRGKAWTRLGQALYCWTGWHHDRCQLLSAWKRLLPPEAVFSGATAAWLWGVDLARDDPVEVIVPPAAGVRSRRGLHIRHLVIDPQDIAMARGFPATTMPRTLCDLCARLPLPEALIAADMALFKTKTEAKALIDYAAKGRPGAARLRWIAALAAPAESPMESRLRWLLLQAGLPHPEVQTDLRDVDGRFVGRADLYYPAARLILEYDGTNHRERLIEDNRRQNLMVSAGFKLLRFTAADLERPLVVASQVRRALHESEVRSARGRALPRLE